MQPLRQELSKLGWTEGKNIAFEYRFAEGQPERQNDLAAELVRLKLDLIVVAGTGPALAAKRRHRYHPNRDGECWGPGSCRFGCQSGAAGRKCHGVLEL